ncbi:unnamed protein product [Ophioblennius macclurei]
MDDVQNFSALGARPQQKNHRPLRYQDYETNLPRADAHSKEDEHTALPVSTSVTLSNQSENSGGYPQGRATLLRTELKEIQHEMQCQQEAFCAGMQQMMNQFKNLRLHSPSAATATKDYSHPAKEDADQSQKESSVPPPPFGSSGEAPPTQGPPGPVGLQRPTRGLSQAKQSSLAGTLRNLPA